MAFLSKDRTIAQPAPRRAKPSSDDMVPIKGLAEFGATDAVVKALKTLHETLCNGLKEATLERFINAGISKGGRPANFKAIEGKATASIQLKNLSSALTVDAQEILNRHGIPLLVTDEIAETFVINPKYAEDAVLFGKLEKALAKIGAPEDLFLHQSKKKVCAKGDETLDAIFKLRKLDGKPDRATIETLLPLVATQAIKVDTTESLEACLDVVDELLDAVIDETVAV